MTCRRKPLLRTRVLWLLAWALLAAVHLPALLVSWNEVLRAGLDATRLGGCLGLSAALVFFLLKLLNLEILRFDTSIKSRVIITIAVVLLHSNVLQKHLDAALVSKNVPLVATTMLCLGVNRVQRAIEHAVRQSSGKCRQRLLALPPGYFTRLWAARPSRWILTSRLCIPRAPPA